MNLKGNKLKGTLLAVSLIAALSSCGNANEENSGESSMTSSKSDIKVSFAETYETETNVSEESEIRTETETTTEKIQTTSAAEESETETTTTTTTAPVVLKGDFYDSHGSLLMYSETDSDGAEKRVMTDEYCIAFANIIHEMSGGFDAVFEDSLRELNPVQKDGENKVGKSVQLTIDGNVQNSIYSYMENNNIVGSVVAMRTDGSIMAEVSYPSYNPEWYLSDEDYADNIAWGAFGNKAFQNATPGSCFKIMSEVISDKNGVTVLYDDGTWTDEGATIVNWDHDTNYSYPIAERTLYSAFVNSSNIFFAKSFNQIGTETVLNDLDNIFHFVSDIYCDFGPIQNNIEIYCNDDLRRSAFGQSYVLTCPIYLAALGREAVFGDMVKPFVIKNIIDTSDGHSVIDSGTGANQVIASIPEEYRSNLLEGMRGVASNLGVYVPGYTLYAKTGTAEVGGGDYLYITGCLKNDNDNTQNSRSYQNYDNYGSNGSYIIVMQIQNPSEHGFNFASESGAYYQGIAELVAGK